MPIETKLGRARKRPPTDEQVLLDRLDLRVDEELVDADLHGVDLVGDVLDVVRGRAGVGEREPLAAGQSRGQRGEDRVALGEVGAERVHRRRNGEAARIAS